ncbi:hypothetical protein LRS73_27685 [Methylobacterium currus]|uniref:hypothetical protein n=1 Tax=Methylobacterium currus TaxID=2051553 RepID=UPI001E3075BC|nr:hypothetical protein [Methylobacterium currus]UHC16208.1 hypothetical protein LRS73_27685 [Methylobacterium currus]
MLREVIVDSFAGGGASEYTSVRHRSKLDLLTPGEEDHGDLIAPAPYDPTEKVVFGVLQPKNDPIVRANAWINDNESTRASDIAHIARNRLAFALHPQGTTPHQRIRFQTPQFTCSQLDPTSSDRLVFLRFVPDPWNLLERIVQQSKSPRRGLIGRSRSRHRAPDLPLFAAAAIALSVWSADVIQSGCSHISNRFQRKYSVNLFEAFYKISDVLRKKYASARLSLQSPDQKCTDPHLQIQI